jgi:hypothetical protein
MWHEDEEVKQAANEDGGELAEQAGEHAFGDSVEDGSLRV